jgi:hypothetical protein
VGRYPDALLDSLRTRGDPAADRVIEDLAATAQIRAVNELLKLLIRNEDPLPAQLPRSVAAWLTDTGCLPDWADRPRMERGSRLVVDHGPQIGVILGAASLPYLYAAFPDVKVLTFSTRMASDPYRRVGETAQFVLAVTAPQGMSAQGKGIRKIQKVRLLHAAIRHLVGNSDRWDTEAWGVPINQDALGGTLMSFSVVVIRALERLGVTVGAAEADDYLYRWRVIGEMLGIAPDVIPPDMAGAEELTDAFARRHHHASPDGVLMTGALLEMIANTLPAGCSRVGPSLMRYLCGDDLADKMEVPPARGWNTLIKLSGPLGRIANVAQSTPGMAQVVNTLGAIFMSRAAVQLAGRSRSASFAIPVPATLERRWTASGVFPTLDPQALAALADETARDWVTKDEVSRIGPYAVDAILGVGGMSHVYKARGPSGTEVALKLVKPDIARDATFRRRFDREVRIARTVVHPNVVAVVDFGEHDGSPYMVQRLVRGGSLEGELERRTTLDPRTLARVCVEVAGALDAVHAAGLVHRDVKPGNILLDEDGTAHITDFGLAKDAQDSVLTRRGQALGSLDYMAPEQIRGEELTAAADVYALACVVFECLTGKPPFAHERGMQVMRAHLQDAPGDPCTKRIDLPPAVGAAVLRGLEKDAADRPQSAGAFAALLAAAIGD